MSRIRTIKPGFWRHEELSALPEATHILAAALLNYADDFGYFNANPGLIRAECSPLREPSIPIPESLRSLHGINFIALGKGDDGKTYGRIVKFDEHQRVSNATPSKIAEKSIDWENSGKLPEPLAKIPEPLRPEGNKEGNKEEEEEGGVEGKAETPPPPTAADVVALWSEVTKARNFPEPQKLTEQRKIHIKARLADAGGLAGMRTAFERVVASPTLRGERNGAGHAGWRADFDWVLKESNFCKIMEGKYDDRNPGAEVQRNGNREPRGQAAFAAIDAEIERRLEPSDS